MCRWLFAIVLVLGSVVGCKPASKESRQEGQKESPAAAAQTDRGTGKLAGSKTCRDCHEEFYKLWSTSWHGLAMQPYTAEFAKANLTSQEDDVTIGKRKYRAEIGDAAGRIREIGPDGEHNYPIAHVMGGKNVYYFLTPLERGRLQVLPVAYDVHKKTWYDMAASGVRHFPDRRDEALDWTDRMFAFNTTCFNCHVSELATNYDLANRYLPHHLGRAGHQLRIVSRTGGTSTIRAMEAGIEGHTSKDIKIIRTKEFTAEQMNDMCATCHAKLVPLSTSFLPGDKFFDHFDLITLEHQDFYPDGRDLGENYTYTSWLMSPCVKSGKLDCNHCHTPSGRMRFQGEQSQPIVHALPRKLCQKSRRTRPSSAGQQGKRVHRLPHAHDAVCGDGPHRPLDAAARSGRDHRLQVAQRLQPVPCRQGRGLVRRVGSQVVSARLPGRGAAPGRVDRPGSQARLETTARNAGRTKEERQRSGIQEFAGAIAERMR